MEYGGYMDKVSTELVGLWQSLQGMTKREALLRLKSMTPEGQRVALGGLRQLKLERDGQQRLEVGDVVYPTAPPVSTKKVPYTLLLPPAMLEAVKGAVELDGSSVSQFIRSAVADKLRGRK